MPEMLPKLVNVDAGHARGRCLWYPCNGANLGDYGALPCLVSIELAQASSAVGWWL